LNGLMMAMTSFIAPLSVFVPESRIARVVPESIQRFFKQNRAMKCYGGVKICAAANACLFFRQNQLPIL
jgi:hypothetical protein